MPPDEIHVRVSWIHSAIALVTLVALFAGGAAGFDRRYAKAGEVQDVKRDVKRVQLTLQEGQLNNRMLLLQTERRTIQTRMEERTPVRAVPTESQRLREIADDLARIDTELATIRGKLALIPEKE